MAHYKLIDCPNGTQHGDKVRGHKVCLLAQTDQKVIFGYVVSRGGDVTDEKRDPKRGEQLPNNYVPEPTWYLK